MLFSAFQKIFCSLVFLFTEATAATLKAPVSDTIIWSSDS